MDYGEFSKLYPAHLAAVLEAAYDALTAEKFDALVVSAGTPQRYFAGDQEVPFKTNPPFAHFVPLSGPHHVLYVAPGRKPLLIRVQPEDFWQEHAPLSDAFWKDEFEFVETTTPETAWSLLPKRGRVAYVGDDEARARSLGVLEDGLNPDGMVRRLEWRRSFKTPYEVACIAEANHLAGHAHAAAREAFLDGAPELEIHYAYVDELGVVDKELPYESIVALDEKAAFLHYQGKRIDGKGTVLLLDAGATFLGYASDVTRTYVYEDECDFLFRGLVGGMETVQQELARLAVPNASFPELHRAAHVKIGDLLRAFGILDISGEEALARSFTRAFFPHGLGHFLGIQVHDVGGSQADPAGGAEPAPPEFPQLRMTRRIEPGMVFTVEPGLYFIDLLLKPLRTGEDAKHFDWELIDRLKRFGGIRIEDDIVATKEGNRNITREFLP